MKSYPISGLTLVGYYGFDNLGDDLLLLSSLLLIKEVGFSGTVFVPTLSGLEKFPQRFLVNPKIEPVRRYDPFKISSAINHSNLTIFGGGNLFQDKTSLRSFLYYYWVARETIRKKKNFLMLSQGFGPITRNANDKRLKKILGSAKTSGMMRDSYSHSYFSGLSDNAYLGTDYGPYYLVKEELLQRNVEKKKGLAVVVPKNGIGSQKLIDVLKSRGFTSICSIGFNNHYDETKRLELEKCARKNGFNIITPPNSLGDIVKLFASAEMILSERLHGVILAIALGTPFAWKSGQKVDNFIYSLDSNCRLSYSDKKNSVAKVIDAAVKYDFEGLSQKYLLELEKTVIKSKELIGEMINLRCK